MRVVTIGNAALYCGDAREILPGLQADVVVTDPPWDQATGIQGSENPRGLFAQVADSMARSRCVAVILGCYSDPCYLAPLASRMPFLHVVWLRQIPASYRGRILCESVVGYVYGSAPKSVPGRRVIPASTWVTGCESAEVEMMRGNGRNRSGKAFRESNQRIPHPMARRLKHMRWLVEWHSDTDEAVLDPFMGSGTTGIACAQLGRRFIGIEIEPRFFDVACRRIEQEQRQARIA